MNRNSVHLSLNPRLLPYGVARHGNQCFFQDLPYPANDVLTPPSPSKEPIKGYEDLKGEFKYLDSYP